MTDDQDAISRGWPWGIIVSEINSRSRRADILNYVSVGPILTAAELSL